METERYKFDWNYSDILWGLTDENTDRQVMEMVKQLINKHPSLPTATVAHGHPECRVISYYVLSDGNIYFMTSKGKPFYQQLCANPELVANSSIDGHYALKIHAFVKDVTTDKAIWDEFFSINPGTMKMYRKNPDIMVVYKLEKGEGEMFHLYQEERIRRMRFAFGGMEKLPMTYKITDRCIGCGACMDSCVEKAIHKDENGKCYIRYMDCDDCGICYTKCPLAGTAMLSNIEDK